MTASKGGYGNFKYSFPVFMCNYNEIFEFLNFPVIPSVSFSYYILLQWQAKQTYLWQRTWACKVQRTEWLQKNNLKDTETSGYDLCNSNIPSCFLLWTKTIAQGSQQVQQSWHQWAVPTTTLKCLADHSTFCMGGKTWSLIHNIHDP